MEVGQTVRARLLAGSLSWMDGRIESIDVSRTTELPSSLLDANHGGPIATVNDPPRAGQERSQLVRDALFRVRVVLDEPLSADQMALVRVRIDGRSESLISGTLRRLASVLIRESGF